MRIASVQATEFRGFKELTIRGLPRETQLVVLTGPNGSGKSSIFDAFQAWHHRKIGQGRNYFDYDNRTISSTAAHTHHTNSVIITFHEPQPPQESLTKAFYFRSAYRNDPDFRVDSIGQTKNPLTSDPHIRRMIDNDSSRVSDNYQRIVSSTVEGVYSQDNDSLSVQELRELLIGKVRTSMSRVFPDLILQGVGNPFDRGTFLFEKGEAKGFRYLNLSGGEKAAFDLLLDFIVKARFFDDTVFCIDEPEGHIHSRLQGALLEELTHLMGENCQLWIATHSIGMIRKAHELYRQDPKRVTFLDLESVNFDVETTLKPVRVDRKYWLRILDVAMDDLSTLVGPELVVICEGKPGCASKDSKSDFDSRCFYSIFGDTHPEAAFISVGSANDVMADSMGLQRAFQTVTPGTRLIRLIDRDDRNDNEIEILANEGIRVLGRRQIESYLYDDEVLRLLCEQAGKPDATEQVLNAKKKAIRNSVSRGNPADDIKSATGELFNAIRAILFLTQCGSTPQSFAIEKLAPLIKPGTVAYDELHSILFES